VKTSVSWHKWSSDKGMKLSTLGLEGQRSKVTRGRRYIWRPGGGINLDPVGSSMFFWLVDRVVRRDHVNKAQSSSPFRKSSSSLLLLSARMNGQIRVGCRRPSVRRLWSVRRPLSLSVPWLYLGHWVKCCKQICSDQLMLLTCDFRTG